MFKSIVKLFGFKQLVKKFTRIAETSSTTIDLILSNAARSMPVATSLSNHDMVACIRRLINNVKNPKRLNAETIRTMMILFDFVNISAI